MQTYTGVKHNLFLVYHFTLIKVHTLILIYITYGIAFQYAMYTNTFC